jgi:hypothetical protein
VTPQVVATVAQNREFPSISQRLCTFAPLM